MSDDLHSVSHHGGVLLVSPYVTSLYPYRLPFKGLPRTTPAAQTPSTARNTAAVQVSNDLWATTPTTPLRYVKLG